MLFAECQPRIDAGICIVKHQPSGRSRYVGIRAAQKELRPYQDLVEREMTKGMDKRKETKKKPAKSPKEKRAEKAAKRKPE